MNRPEVERLLGAPRIARTGDEMARALAANLPEVAAKGLLAEEAQKTYAIYDHPAGQYNLVYRDGRIIEVHAHPAPPSPSIRTVPSGPKLRAPPPAPVPPVIPQPASHSPRWLAAVIVVAVVLVVGLMVAAGVALRRREQPAPQASDQPAPAAAEWSVYRDPKGRFTCQIPAGWQAQEFPEDARSKVNLSSGNDEIKIITRDTTKQVMDESDRVATVASMEQQLKQLGAKGRVIGVTWRDTDGVRGLQEEMEMTRPGLYIRNIKYKKDGWDHSVGIYIQSRDRQDELLALFEQFIGRYQSGIAQTAMSASTTQVASTERTVTVEPSLSWPVLVVEVTRRLPRNLWIVSFSPGSSRWADTPVIHLTISGHRDLAKPERDVKAVNQFAQNLRGSSYIRSNSVEIVSLPDPMSTSDLLASQLRFKLNRALDPYPTAEEIARAIPPAPVTQERGRTIGLGRLPGIPAVPAPAAWGSGRRVLPGSSPPPSRLASPTWR